MLEQSSGAKADETLNYDDISSPAALSNEEEEEKHCNEDEMVEEDLEEHQELVVKYIPNVPSDDLPYVGKTFGSSDDALAFYNNYARLAGFSTRRHSNIKNADGTDRSRTFTCCRQGKTNLRYQVKDKHSKPRSGERKRGRSRCLCLASLIVKKLKNRDAWTVSKFTAEHTHPLTSPGKVQFLPSHRNVTPVQKSLLDQMSQANIRTCQQFRFLEITSGDPDSVGCQERDIRNVERDKRQKKLGHDVETLVKYFECEKEADQNYYYSIETEEGVFSRCFWADSTSRSAYAYFGDVVVFDTTYNTNTYGMILAPFIGVNHHRQTVIFGCGLLSNERTESFTWLFSQFLQAMPTGVAPKVIITDQDQAIGGAIASVFPPTVHRLCLWHITNKFSEKLGPTLYSAYNHVLSDIVNRSETPDEFEKKWGALMSTTPLGGIEWLRNMYVIRMKWVPAYVRHLFAAGMTSSQRVESHHSFLKAYVIRKNSLSDFMVRFKHAVRHQRHLEVQADHIDKSEVPLTLTNHHMEPQMRILYTKSMFLLFQEELVQSSSYDYQKISSTNDEKMYRVSRFDTVSSRPRHVTLKSGHDAVMSCSCKLFEFSGYLCRHILLLMYRKGMRVVPDHYILKRWTKHAKLVPVFEPNLEPSDRESPISVRTKMINDFASMANEVYMLPTVRNFVIHGLSELQRQSREMIASIEPVTVDNGSEGASGEEVLRIYDPDAVRAKGSGKRLKSSKEKGMSQSNRKCGRCRRPGHNAKTCPENNSRNVMFNEDYTPDMSLMNGRDGDATTAATFLSQGADNYSSYVSTIPDDEFLGQF